ncbi:hypothetical protein ACXYN8_09445 [Altererythrobacter sp. CAU 1778]
MTKIRLNTLLDFLNHGYMVQIFCTACGHKLEVQPMRLIRRCQRSGQPMHIHKLQRHLRCSKCREKRAEIYPGGYVISE